MNARQDKSLLLNTARAVVEELWLRTEGTSLNPRWPSRAAATSTGGWRACIGLLGRGDLSMQIWLDLYSGYDVRKFNFCIFSHGIEKMRRLARRAAKEMPRHRTVTEKDMVRNGYQFLKERLRRDEFGEVILEEYYGKVAYYGIYDVTVRSSEMKPSPRLCARAVSFFETVARTLPGATPEGEEAEVYPQFENRKRSVTHLQRERSIYLADRCKARDNYKCLVCDLRFVDVYGQLGKDFAEAHHRIPLGQLDGRVRTRLDDLATVCANCHQMLHQMEGKRDDVERLRAIVDPPKQWKP
jgi:5-methylcytosine-specific restriction endonuclease McrA